MKWRHFVTYVKRCIRFIISDWGCLCTRIWRNLWRAILNISHFHTLELAVFTQHFEYINLENEIGLHNLTLLLVPFRIHSVIRSRWVRCRTLFNLLSLTELCLLHSCDIWIQSREKQIIKGSLTFFTLLRTFPFLFSISDRQNYHFFVCSTQIYLEGGMLWKYAELIRNLIKR